MSFQLLIFLWEIVICSQIRVALIELLATFSHSINHVVFNVRYHRMWGVYFGGYIMNGCKRLDQKEGWTLKNQCFWTVMWGKTPESLEQQGDQISQKGNQPWIFIGKTDAEAEAPTLWPPDAKSRLVGKDPDAGKDWRQEEKGTTEDEMVGWHHRLDGHRFCGLRELVIDREATQSKALA